MSGFTESAFERKAAELNASQQSIQSLSTWLVHHRKHHQTIVKVWYKEFLKSQEHRKLTFIYLANDVVQNSRKKGNEFGKAFAPVFKKAFEYMARIPGDKTKKSLLRILGIWKERGIYEPTLIKDFEATYLKAWDDLHGDEEDEFDLLKSGVTTPPDPRDKDAATTNEKDKDPDVTDKGGPSTSTSSTQPQPPERKKRVRTKKEESDSALRKRRMNATNTIDEWETDGVVQLEVKLSPSPYGEPPTEEEILQMLRDMDRMPSTDAETRGKIAALPTKVSNVSGVDEICVDSDATRSLQIEIHDSFKLLMDYNRKLDTELDDRKRFSMKLQDFLHAQKDLLNQAEQRLEDHQNHEKVLVKKLDELKSHVLSMPDLTKLPSVTDGLAPLPSAGDLFL